MILKFKNPIARGMFLDMVKDKNPSILKAFRESESMPTVIVSESLLTEDEKDWIMRNLGEGQIFDDVQFKEF